jgi:hypothetical protein
MTAYEIRTFISAKAMKPVYGVGFFSESVIDMYIRRYIALLTLAAITMTACDSAPRDPGPGPSAPTLIQTLQTNIQRWLDQVVHTTPGRLRCSGYMPAFSVQSTSPESVRACMRDDGQQYLLRAQNRTGIPITLNFMYRMSVTIPPGGITDVPLVDVADGQFIFFQGDPTAAATSAMISYLLGKAQHSPHSWSSCISKISIGCLASNLSALLPAAVRVGRFLVPLRLITEVFQTVVTYAPLVSTLLRQSFGYKTSGTLTWQAL